MESNGLAHTKWNCKYHIVFAPKYRRKIIYGELKAAGVDDLVATYQGAYDRFCESSK